MGVHYDLIVVGGGIGGLSAAITAKKSGVPSVLVLERAEACGRGVICGGGLPNKFVDLFPGILNHLDEMEGRHYTGDESVWYRQGEKKICAYRFEHGRVQQEQVRCHARTTG